MKQIFGVNTDSIFSNVKKNFDIDKSLYALKKMINFK
mgnify:CR=1 FL=1